MLGSPPEGRASPAREIQEYHMETTSIVLEKILFIGVLVAVGFLCGKLRVIDHQTNLRLTDVLLLIVVPSTILSSYQITFTPELANNLLIALGLAAVSHALQLVCAYVLIRKGRPNTEVERISTVYSNCGFMGIPLIHALYGAEGVLYLTAYLTCFNLLLFTHGVVMMSGQTDWKLMLKQLCSPALIATFVGVLIFLLRIRLPEVLVEAVGSLGSMNTPLAMLIAGASIAESDLKACFCNRRIYWILAIKMLIIPAVVMLAMFRLPVDPTVLYVIVIAASCPTAAIGTMFANRYGKNGGYAAQIFTLTTLVSLVTIPLVALAFGAML